MCWVREGFFETRLFLKANCLRPEDAAVHKQAAALISRAIVIQRVKVGLHLDLFQDKCKNRYSEKNTCGGYGDLLASCLLLSVIFLPAPPPPPRLIRSRHGSLRSLCCFSWLQKELSCFCLWADCWAPGHPVILFSFFLNPSTETQPHLQTPVLLSCPYTAPCACTHPMFLGKVSYPPPCACGYVAAQTIVFLNRSVRTR